MSKFKVGDIIQCVNDDWASYLTLGKSYRVVALERDGRPAVINNNNDKCPYESQRFILAGKSEHKPENPAKKHTETDRRKAAKAVRVAEAKLSDAIKKAQDTGIEVSMVNVSVGLIDVEMSFQPETPKKRVYK